MRAPTLSKQTHHRNCGFTNKFESSEGTLEVAKKGASLVEYSLGLLHPSLEVLKRSAGFKLFHVDTVTLDLAIVLESDEIRVNVRGESVFTGDENLLSAWELELGTTESLLSVGHVLDLGPDGDQDGADVDTGDLAEGLSVSVTHTGLKSISTGAREHLVDADHVPWVDSNSDMETFFTSVVGHVLVSSNTGGLESLR